MDQPINPYITGAPLREGQGFFGRHAALDWAAQALSDPAANALVFLGQRSIGKTSLLLQLERALPDDVFLPVYFDLQGQAARPLGQVLAGMAGALARQAGLRPPGANLFDGDDAGDFFRRTFLPRFYAAALGDGRRPVFLLDEFDALDEAVEAELPQTAAGRALFPFLREVRAGDSRSAFVFAAGRRAADFGAGLNAAFDTPLVREVAGLDWESDEELIRQAEVDGTLQFSALAVSHVSSFTNGHPYLTQLLCQQIWQRACTGNPTELPLVDTLAVDEAVPDALQAGGQTLAWLWDGLNPAEKVYAAGLAGIAGAGEAVSDDGVVRMIGDYAARMYTPKVELAPASLARRWVLEQTREREHSFAAELVRLWVHQNKPPHVVVDEVGWTAPPTKQLFTAAHPQARDSAPLAFQNGHSDGAPLAFQNGHADGAPLAFQNGHSDGAPSTPVQAPPFPLGERAAMELSPAAPLDRLLEEQDDLETAPTGADLARSFNLALRVVLPAIVVPVLSSLVFYAIGVNLARGMSLVARMPPLFDAASFYRFGLVSAILGLFAGLGFSYRFIKQPVINLELVYLSLYRFVRPFMAVILIYALLAVLAWVSQVSLSEDEWGGFRIFFDLLRRLLEK